jgi:hypothetical protein
MPSESCFQTVLWNNKTLKIYDYNRGFIVWDDSRLAHPKMLTIEDLEAMARSDKDFGRKFDAEVDSTILDELDRRLREPVNPVIGMNRI